MVLFPKEKVPYSTWYFFPLVLFFLVFFLFSNFAHLLRSLPGCCHFWWLQCIAPDKKLPNLLSVEFGCEVHHLSLQNRCSQFSINWTQNSWNCFLLNFSQHPYQWSVLPWSEPNRTFHINYLLLKRKKVVQFRCISASPPRSMHRTVVCITAFQCRALQFTAVQRRMHSASTVYFACILHSLTDQSTSKYNPAVRVGHK